MNETYVGGKRSGRKGGRGAPGKAIVFGMFQRGGDVMTRVAENARRSTLESVILEKIKAGSQISRDELRCYAKLSRHGYRHGAVN